MFLPNDPQTPWASWGSPLGRDHGDYPSFHSLPSWPKLESGIVTSMKTQCQRVGLSLETSLRGFLAYAYSLVISEYLTDIWHLYQAWVLLLSTSNCRVHLPAAEALQNDQVTDKNISFCRIFLKHSAYYLMGSTENILKKIISKLKFAHSYH